MLRNRAIVYSFIVLLVAGCNDLASPGGKRISVAESNQELSIQTYHLADGPVTGLGVIPKNELNRYLFESAAYCVVNCLSPDRNSYYWRMYGTTISRVPWKIKAIRYKGVNRSAICFDNIEHPNYRSF